MGDAEDDASRAQAPGSGAETPFVLELSSTQPQVTIARQEVDAYLRSRGITGRTLHAVSLCLEELLTNIIRHGYGDQPHAGIMVETRLDGHGVQLRIEDAASPFDPTAVPLAPVPSSLLEAPIGGRGLAMVRHYARAMRYERRGDRNLLEVEI